MIYWIFLLLAVTANVVKGFCTKKLSGTADNFYENTLINFFRALICAVMGFVIILSTGSSLALTKTELLYCVVSGVSMTLFQIAWLMSLKNGAYTMVSAFSSASFIIPCLVGFTLLGDELTWQKLLAIASISTAIFFLCRYNNKTKTRITVAAFVFLVLVSVSQGVNQIFQKLYNNLPSEGGASSSLITYTFYTFAVSSVITLVMCLAMRSFDKGMERRMPSFGRTDIGLICLSAVGIYAANYLQTFAARGIDASVMYPILNGLSLCAGTTMSIVAFGEKPKLESVIGVSLVFVAIMLNTLFK